MSIQDRRLGVRSWFVLFWSRQQSVRWWRQRQHRQPVAITPTAPQPTRRARGTFRRAARTTARSRIATTTASPASGSDLSSEIVVPIVTAVFGFAGGVVTTLLGPWAKWRVEKTRLQRQRRVERIAEWRGGGPSLRFAGGGEKPTPFCPGVVVFPHRTKAHD